MSAGRSTAALACVRMPCLGFVATAEPNFDFGDRALSSTFARSYEVRG